MLIVVIQVKIYFTLVPYIQLETFSIDVTYKNIASFLETVLYNRQMGKALHECFSFSY